jgi:hypothetical protein
LPVGDVPPAVLGAKVNVSIVRSRPLTKIWLLATYTKRLSRWKKSAKSKYVPLKLNVSATVSRAGVVVDAGAVVPVVPVVDVVPVPASAALEA